MIVLAETGTTEVVSPISLPSSSRTFLLPPVSWTFTKRRVYLSLFMARPLLRYGQRLSYLSLRSVRLHRRRSVGQSFIAWCFGGYQTYGSFFFSEWTSPSVIVFAPKFSGVLVIRTLLVNLGGLRLDLAGTGAECRELVRIFPFPFLPSR